MQANKRTFTVLATIAAAFIAACAFLMAGCEESSGGAGSAEIKAMGYSSTATYTPYTDLGGYGSDFTIVVYNELTLYEDNTYTLSYNQFNYAGAWSVIVTETDAKAFGTYTVVSEDEFGIVVDLSAATRVISKGAVQSTVVWQDTDDINTFTATEDKTAEALQQELLGQYAAKSGVEIDYETYALVLPE